MTAKKLNLGSGPGKFNLEGYENIDLLDGENVYPLDFESETVDEIRASHILEHFGKKELQAVLRDWCDKLKDGGILKIAVPDFKKVAEKYIAAEKTDHKINDYVMGGQDDENDFHKSIFDEEMLRHYMTEAGLVDIEPWESEISDCASYDISLNLAGRKAAPVEKKVTTKIQAVMTLPRLGFTDNLCSAIGVFPQLGIDFKARTGVFWGQMLTALLEEFTGNGTEYIITIDYDTWFKKEHVIRLCQLMAEHKDVDAIVPVQTKRENEVPLFSIVTPEGVAAKKVSVSVFDEELVPIVGGHFGLTIFRVSAFCKLEKPWFMPHPDKDGGWGDGGGVEGAGKIDEDIHFWQNFYRCGLKACLATRINVGHLQITCTFPGSASNGFKPVHIYMSDIEKGRYPENAVPEIELLK